MSSYGISTFAFENRELDIHLLRKIFAAGYRHIELVANRPHLDYHNRSLQKEVANWFLSNELPPPSLHLPFEERLGPKRVLPISALAPEERRRNAAIDEIKRALEISDRMSLAGVVLHLGVPGQGFGPVDFDHAYTVVEAIRAFAGVDVLIENIPNDISTLERIREFIDVARLRDVHICYDSGHGHLEGPLGQLDRVAAIHIHDNHGELDDHLWPFDGTLNWARFVEELVMSDYHGPMIFEVSDERIERGWKTVERLEDLLGQARSSPDEFRMKHDLRSDNSDLH